MAKCACFDGCAIVLWDLATLVTFFVFVLWPFTSDGLCSLNNDLFIWYAACLVGCLN